MGCYDHIFSLRQILEHRLIHQQETIQVFIDFVTAFDLVKRIAIWDAMRDDGVPKKIVCLIKAYYVGTRAFIRADGEISKEISIDKGVQQGCALNFVIDQIMKTLDKYKGVTISPALSITDLDYANDVDILAESIIESQLMIGDIAARSLATGLKISQSKTKSMRNSGLDETRITLNGIPIEDVQNFKYLGSLINPKGEALNKIQSRISAAWAAFIQLRKCLWLRNEISLQTKLWIYNALVLSVLLYGCKIWPLRAGEANNLNVFHHKCLCCILGLRLSDRVSNDVIRRRCGDIPLVSDVVKARRQPNDLFSKQCLKCQPLGHWKKKPGGQKKTWLSTVRANLKPMGGFKKHRHQWNRQWIQLIEPVAFEREQWRDECQQILDAMMGLDKAQT
ncbi:uncharacterized protein LOC136030599 [Artemia franciscana]|uniref:uncharacterized protein LOC136030599 n=1 Tax=Artemia franciscana TaxID=6661 RepID=UPI0032DBD589